MKKLILGFVLMAALLTAMLPVAALAEEETVEFKEWENILLLGGDSRTQNGYERTDSMIILSVNVQERRVKMTSIMRDTWVQFPGLNKSHKINAANVFGGPELSMRTVNEYFGTDIDKYILINMRDMIAIIDLVDGVDIDVTESERRLINSYASSFMKHLGFYSGDTYLDKTGFVHLNGLLAMSYTRNRYSDSDYHRVMRQQEVLLALGERLQEMDVEEMMKIVDAMHGLVQTNLEDDELEALSKVAMVVELDDVLQNRIPVDGTFQDGMHNGYWMIRPNFEKNKELLHDFIYD